jgi:CTP-dependent riboflavin kinase
LKKVATSKSTSSKEVDKYAEILKEKLETSDRLIGRIITDFLELKNIYESLKENENNENLTRYLIEILKHYYESVQTILVE